MKSEAYNTYVGSIMTRDVKTVDKETELVEACKILDRHKINSVVVTDENEVKGILTSSDIVSVVSNGENAEESTVEDAMTENVITLQTTDLVSHAADLILDNNIHHVPVIDDNSVIGIVSTSDVSAYLHVY